jgi:hypothetical protein
MNKETFIVTTQMTILVILLISIYFISDKISDTNRLLYCIDQKVTRFIASFTVPVYDDLNPEVNKK